MMKNLRNNQRGVAHLAAIFGIILLAVVAFAGYRVMNNANNKKDAAKSSTTTTASTAVPATIQNKADIQQASKALDSDQSNSALDPSQLDSDLNSIL